MLATFLYQPLALPWMLSIYGQVRGPREAADSISEYYQAGIRPRDPAPSTPFMSRISAAP